MMKSQLFFFFIAWICIQGTHAQTSADQIIKSSISLHGGEKYLNSKIRFDFRDKSYSYEMNDGIFVYIRSFLDEKTGNKIIDKLSNNGLERTINGKPTRLSRKHKTSYSSSVNSVIYFALLPHFLSDEAVQAERLADETIQGNEYFKIRVTFTKEGGGEDYEDIFVYWIDQEDFRMDYLAYSYEVEGGGVRFRQAFNSRKCGGILFQDYINYKHDKNTPVDQLGNLFNEGKLTELSRIELKYVSVEPNI